MERVLAHRAGFGFAIWPGYVDSLCWLCVWWNNRAFLRWGHVADRGPELSQVKLVGELFNWTRERWLPTHGAGLGKAKGVLKWEGFTPPGLELSLWVCSCVRYAHFLDMLSLPNEVILQIGRRMPSAVYSLLCASYLFLTYILFCRLVLW